MIGRAIGFFVTYAGIIIPLVLVGLMIVSESVRASVAVVVRTIARALLIVAVIALVYDGTRTLASAGGLVITSLGAHWQNFSPGTLAGLKVLVGYLHPQAWDQVVMRVLVLPAWLVIGALGLLLAWVARKRRKINVYVN